MYGQSIIDADVNTCCIPRCHIPHSASTSDTVRHHSSGATLDTCVDHAVRHHQHREREVGSDRQRMYGQSIIDADVNTCCIPRCHIPHSASTSDTVRHHSSGATLETCVDHAVRHHQHRESEVGSDRQRMYGQSIIDADVNSCCIPRYHIPHSASTSDTVRHHSSGATLDTDTVRHHSSGATLDTCCIPRCHIPHSASTSDTVRHHSSGATLETCVA
ncbi:hypothetical protein J6590_003055 [Homalodisca vitripennis]|nr:hypothetical protein J6590_003055 [Homalodisca vitripennis]